ncbi:MAG: hypothetical protein RLO52_20985 [Sandaracinaceae bacterium]
MDEFEEKVATGEGAILFRDKVPIPRFMLALFLLAPLMIFGMLAFVASFPPTQAALIAFVMGAVALLGNLALMGLRVVVSDGGIDVHVGMRKFHYDFADITRVEAATYRVRDYPLGRGSVKTGMKGKAFVGALSVKDGVALTLRSGRVALITSNDPEGLERAVRARVSDPTRVRVDGVEAGEEHVVEAAGPEVSDQRRVR